MNLHESTNHSTMECSSKLSVEIQSSSVKHGSMSAPSTDDEFDKKLRHLQENKDEKPYKVEIIWTTIIILSYLHIGSIYAIYLCFTSAKLATTLFAIFLYQFTMWGVTAGAHRLWSHRTYKANWPLRLLLMIMFTTAYQHSIIKWARDHRVHHKHTDTNADPYCSKRGFFFSHIGWLMCVKHPDVPKKGKEIDVSDLFNDPIVKFQYDHIGVISWLLAYIIPTIIPMYFWNETFSNSFHIAVCLRWTFTYNVVGLVNSAAHMFGTKPYDKNMSAVENVATAILTSGEAWHNYHHAFPWDYKAAELGKYSTNTTTGFIDFFGKIGWAYDFKAASDDMVRKRVERTGDGSHPVWGWTDEDMTNEDRLGATILSRQYGTKLRK